MWNVSELAGIGVAFEPHKHSFIYTFPPPKYGKAEGLITEPHALLSGLSVFTLYIHVPFCSMDCSFCSLHRKVLKSSTELEYYLRALERELVLIAEKVKGAMLKAIYFGGGTPSIMSPMQIAKILNLISNQFAAVDDVEVCMETAPDAEKDSKYWERYFTELNTATVRFEVNRISLGIQSVNDTSLRQIGRKGGRSAIYHLLEAVDKRFNIYNVDFLLGWPDHKQLYTRNTITQLIEGIWKLKFEFSLPSISLYQLWDTESIRLTKGNEDKLPTENKLLKDKWILQQQLFDMGYQPTITSALVLDRSTQTSEFMKHRHLDFCCIGAGSGAYSILPESLVYRPRDIRKYEQCILSKSYGFDIVYPLTHLELFFRRIIMGLRTFDWLSVDVPAELVSDPDIIVLTKKIQQLEQTGVLEVSGNRIKLMKNSFLISNEISKFLHPDGYPQK